MEKPEELIIMNFKRSENGDTPSLSPITISIPLLNEVLREVDRGVRAYAASLQGQDKSAPIISLVSVNFGSLELGFSSQPQYALYAEAFTKDLQENNWDTMPLKAFEAAEAMYKMSRKLKADLRVSATNLKDEIYIYKDAPLPVRQVGRVTGSVMLAGQILQTGGATPAIDFRVERNNQILHGIKVNMETAKRLAAKLYTPIILKGEAVWNAKTWAIESFTFKDIVETEYQDPIIGLLALQKLIGKTWEGIDIQKRISDMRGGLD